MELLTNLGAPPQPRTSCAARPRVWRTSATLPNVELAQAETLNDNAFKITMVRNTVASLLADLTRRQVGDIGGDLAGQEQKP